jgi:hypothetical protein
MGEVMADHLLRLMGWTFSQWAEAGSYAKRFGVPLSATPSCAHDVRKCWITRRQDEPGGVRLIEVAHEMEFSWADQMMACREWHGVGT